MSRVIHHVEDLTGDRQILQQRAAERSRAAGHRRVRHRISKHRKGFRVRRDGPEALAVGCVGGRLVPVDGRLATVHRKEFVRKPVGEVVEIGEVDLGERTRR